MYGFSKLFSTTFDTMGWFLIIFLFIGLPVLGYYLFTGIFDIFFKSGDGDYPTISNQQKIIDKSVHHHYHDKRQIHVDGKEFKSMISDEKGTKHH